MPFLSYWATHHTILLHQHVGRFSTIFGPIWADSCAFTRAQVAPLTSYIVPRGNTPHVLNCWGTPCCVLFHRHFVHRFILGVFIVHLTVANSSELTMAILAHPSHALGGFPLCSFGTVSITRILYLPWPRCSCCALWPFGWLNQL